MSTLEQTRELDGATLLDDEGRYYKRGDKGEIYHGYFAHFGGAWICYTCGHLCECGE
jgi:hypothetical protein